MAVSIKRRGPARTEYFAVLKVERLWFPTSDARQEGNTPEMKKHEIVGQSKVVQEKNKATEENAKKIADILIQERAERRARKEKKKQEKEMRTRRNKCLCPVIGM